MITDVRTIAAGGKTGTGGSSVTIDRNSPIPLYFQLRGQLKKMIDSGEFADGQPLPTEQVLCEKFGLSRYTVRQALGDLVKDGYLVKVQGKGTFVQRTSKPVTTPTLGLVVPYTTDFFTSQIIQGVERVARNAGYNLIFSNSNNHPEQEDTIISKLKADGVKGFVLFPCENTVYSSVVAELISEGYPVVLVDREFKTLDCPCVVSNNEAGAEMAVNHLVSLGHRRIGLVMTSFSQTSSVQERLLGYRTALAKHRIPWEDSFLLTYTPKLFDAIDDTADHTAVVRQHLSSRHRPTAIFAVNDFVALDVLRSAAAVGLTVPRDLAVVGFDDIPIAGGLPTPLSTVAQSKIRIGETAASMLLDIINGRPLESRKVILPVRLVVRQSCGGGVVRKTGVVENSV